MAKTLTLEEIDKALTGLPDWRHESGNLVSEWKFATFVEAMQFVNRVALIAESIDHHPDIDIRYRHVKLALCSHDVGGITRRDVRFADQLAQDRSEKGEKPKQEI